ncbi:MAG: hypothetical protein IK096_01465, partial [Lachnospiraceae bacterium]|nr:hypothetical protein [Lachnospiraceae bacterium]
PFMRDYGRFRELLAPWFGKEKDGEDEADAAADAGTDTPQESGIDREKLDELYEALREAARSADADAVEVYLMELSGCAMTEEERDLLAVLRKCAAAYDYEGILGSLE